MIGVDPVYRSDDGEHMIRMQSVGKSFDDMILQSFYFDRPRASCISGSPATRAGSASRSAYADTC